MSIIGEHIHPHMSIYDYSSTHITKTADFKLEEIDCAKLEIAPQS
jgi:hypothetical protein